MTATADAQPADDPAYAEALTAGCEAAGCTPERFVAAAGPYGSWLIELTAPGGARRLIWNGKDGRLSLDEPNPGGGWRELSAEALSTPDLTTLQAAVGRLLAGGDAGTSA